MRRAVSLKRGDDLPDTWVGLLPMHTGNKDWAELL
jgi:hypothetical protein